MRRRAAERRSRRLDQLARWLETFWWCRCDYNNIATYRCYHCGARPPRRLRAELDTRPTATEPKVATDA
jgi:hypothetical protein